MRKFNPDKELYKIQHGNKNKVILFVISLLIVGIIGYSFALYQVRYSKRIIYTKVAPFSNKDIQLAVSLDGVPQTKVPEKGTAYYESITCDDDESATAGWDYENWQLTSLTAKVPNKCDINFTTHPMTLIAQIKHVNETNPELVVDDKTKDHNLRYIGNNPDNYVWFNCDNYELVTNAITAEEQNCEKWRIIGLMNNITIMDESTLTETKNQNLVKIIRINAIKEGIQWDSESTNNWETSSLQKTLNGTYFNGKNLNSGKGITTATQEVIEEVTWNLGGWNTNITTLEFYAKERGVTTYNSSRPELWNGKIALMYPSDYGYATSGGSTYNRQQCLDTILYNWNQAGYKENCAENSWLFDSSFNQWTLMPDSSRSDNTFVISASGYVFMTKDGVSYNKYWARPTLFLKTSVKIKNEAGDGSLNSPYIIVP